jgi:hypothetical protein
VERGFQLVWSRSRWNNLPVCDIAHMAYALFKTGRWVSSHDPTPGSHNMDGLLGMGDRLWTTGAAQFFLGDPEMRLPLQLLAAFALLVYCFWLEAREKSFKREGQKAALMLLGLSVNLLLFMPLRADPAPGWLGVRLDVWAAIAFFIPSLVVFLITQRGRVEQNSTLLHGKGT